MRELNRDFQLKIANSLDGRKEKIREHFYESVYFLIIVNCNLIIR